MFALWANLWIQYGSSAFDSHSFSKIDKSTTHTHNAVFFLEIYEITPFVLLLIRRYIRLWAVVLFLKKLPKLIVKFVSICASLDQIFDFLKADSFLRRQLKNLFLLPPGLIDDPNWGLLSHLRRALFCWSFFYQLNKKAWRPGSIIYTG